MADTTNGKIVIELDMETGDFTTKVGSIQSMLTEAGERGKEGFSGMSLEALGLNAALELVQKGVELIHMAVEKMEIAEKMDNQAKALQALSSSIGVNAETLTTAVKKASGDTLTSLQAQQEAFKLLNAGIKAENIPALVELAHQYELTGKTGKSTVEILNTFAMSIESGATRGLKEFGIASGVSGDRQRILNAILSEGSSYVKTLGTDYDSAAEKIKARSQEMWDGVSRWMGHATATAFNFFTNFGGDKADQAKDALKKIEDQIKAIDKAQASGQTTFEVYKNGLVQFVPIEEARALAIAKQSEEQAKLTSTTKEETEEQKKRIEELSKGTAVEKELTNEQLKRIEIDARVIAAQSQISLVRTQGEDAEVKQLTNVMMAKKNQIDFIANQEEQLARSQIKNADALAARIVAIEQKKTADLLKLEQGAQMTEEAQTRGHLKYLEQNARTVEGYSTEVISVQTKNEELHYKNQIAKLRLEEKDKDQFKKKVEEAEIAHQQRLTAIKKQYSDISMHNMQVGITNGLAQLNKEFGDFSAMAQKATVKTQGIMTNAFVAAAKGQGNALELMKQQFIEMIGTQLIQKGTFDLMAGIWPPNPVQLGLGAAEIAAGSALVGASGGGASASAGSYSAGAGGGYASGIASPSQASAQQIQQKSAQIVINGDFLNSSETANHLTQILRQNSDVTDFAIVAQGKQY